MIVESCEYTKNVLKIYTVRNARRHIFDWEISERYHVIYSTTNLLLRNQITSDYSVIQPETHVMVPDRKIEYSALTLGSYSLICHLVANLVQKVTLLTTQPASHETILVVTAVF